VTLTVAEKEAAGLGGAGGAGVVCETRGVGDDEAERREEADGEADRERDGDNDGVGDDEDGSSEIVGDGDSGAAAPTGVVGTEDGRTTVGAAAASLDGPTARTATHTTRATKIVTAARKTKRAALIGGEFLAAGGNASPSGDQQGSAGGTLPNHCMPLIRRPTALLISFCASRAARSCRLS
jgi:hypothetical protein